MEILNFILADGNLPFSISAVFLCLLLVLEIVGVLFSGMGVSALDSLITGDGHELEFGGIAADALGYLHWGKVPVLVLLACLTGVFSLAGFGLQGIAAKLLGAPAPWWLASIPAFGVGVVGTHFIAKPLARLMPSDGAGDAPTQRGMFGLVGEVVLGPISPTSPGEVRVRDLEGRTHFLQVKANADGIEIPVGAEVVVTGHSNSFFTVGVTALSAVPSAASALSASPLSQGDSMAAPIKEGK